MKAFKLLTILIVSLIARTTLAQVAVNVSIGTPPPWGPAGYTEVRYYYIPDVQAYYDVQTSMFIYYGGGVWVRRAYLPTRYRNYDLYSGYKVVMTDYRGDTPYDNYREYKVKYAKGYRGEAQRTIGERPGKGNSGAKISNGSNSRSKAVAPAKSKGVPPGHIKEAPHGNGNPGKGNNGGGNGKK